MKKTTIVKKALENDGVKKYVQGKKYRVVYVAGKVLNMVV